MSKRVLDVYSLMGGVEKYVLSGAVKGVSGVAWHEGPEAFTDGETIHLPRPDALWNDEQVELWRYKAEHELGHEDAINCNPHWRTLMEVHKKDPKYKDDGLLWGINNLISDHVQEHNRVGDMVGRDYILLQGRANFLKNMVFTQPGGAKDKDQAISFGMFLWDTDARMKWNPRLTLPKLDAKSQEVFEMIRDKSGVDLCALKNEEEVWEAALKVRKLFPDVSSKNEMFKVEVEVAKGKLRTDKATEPCMPGGGHTLEKRNYDDYSFRVGSGGSYKARTPIPLKTGSRNRGYESAIVSLIQRTNLPAKVRSYLMAMRREKYTTGWRSGRLDTSRLSDVLRGKDDLFRRKEPVHMVNSAVSLLVDCSGSMSGEPHQNACAAAIMLAEALQGVGCSVEVAGFTEFSGNADGLIHDLWLPFGKRFIRDNMLNHMGKIASYLRNNADGENILWAYNRLKAQKEKRKILIVLSDGEPAAQGPGSATMDIGEFTLDTIRTIEKDKEVLIVGLGMSGYSPKRFYKHAYKVERKQPLEKVLLDVVKNAVLC